MIAPVGGNGYVDLTVSAGAAVDLIADVSGYYLSGSVTAPGGYASVTPARLLDTRDPTDITEGSQVSGGGVLSLPVASRAGVPSGVTSVLLNVTVTQATSAGYLTVYADQGTQPLASNLNYVAGQTVPNLVLAPVGSDGAVALYVGALGSTHLIVDVQGYLRPGAQSASGALAAVAPRRLLDTRDGTGVSGPGVLAAGHVVSLQVAGRGGVPSNAVSSAVLNVTATNPRSSGWVTVWADGEPKPLASSLNYRAGQTVPNLVIAPVGADGRVDLFVSGSTDLIADVSGFVWNASIGTPTTSPSRYVRNLTGTDGSADAATMDGEGCQDATVNGSAGNHLMLLDIGAQTITSPLSAADPGVALSATNPVVRISYPQLVAIVSTYVDGYVRCAGSNMVATIVVGTNNDGDWSSYPAAARGTDWAAQVIEPVRRHAQATPNVLISGGDDIEAGFASSEADAETWIRSYLSATSADLVEHGSADGCPTTAGTIGTSCATIIDENNLAKAWTQANYYALAHGLSPGRIVALPQIYLSAQATQWANIDRTGATTSDKIDFIGVLTELAACGPGCSLTPAAGFTALWNALRSNAVTAPALSLASDLQVDG